MIFLFFFFLIHKKMHSVSLCFDGLDAFCCGLVYVNLFIWTEFDKELYDLKGQIKVDLNNV